MPCFRSPVCAIVRWKFDGVAIQIMLGNVPPEAIGALALTPGELLQFTIEGASVDAASGYYDIAYHFVVRSCAVFHCGPRKGSYLHLLPASNSLSCMYHLVESKAGTLLNPL